MSDNLWIKTINKKTFILLTVSICFLNSVGETLFNNFSCSKNENSSSSLEDELLLLDVFLAYLISLLDF